MSTFFDFVTNRARKLVPQPVFLLFELRTEETNSESFFKFTVWVLPFIIALKYGSRTSLNPFVPNAPFLYLPENIRKP